METIIKEEGIKAIQNNSAAALKKRVDDLSLEANDNLISALYAESLMPSLDEQIGVYQSLIADLESEIDVIEKQAGELKGEEAYRVRRTKKPLEEKAKAYARGRDKLLERKAHTLERINNFRMDAQLIMHKIAHTESLGETAVVDSLVSHIESLKEKLEAPAPVVVEPIEEEEDVEDFVDVADDEEVAEDPSVEETTAD